MKCNHDKKVRSFAKETFGSTRTGRAMRFVAVRWSNGWVDIAGERLFAMVTVGTQPLELSNK